MFKEPISFLFSAEKLYIESDSWKIPCLPGFNITSFYNGEAIQTTEKQEFTFYIKTQDTIDNEIKLKEKFSYSTDCYQYNFEVLSIPIDDITGAGLAKFKASFISRESIA